MTTALQKKASTDIKELLVRATPKIGELLPRGIEVKRFVNAALMQMARTPKLMECTPQSLLMAVMEAAQLGLEPGSVLGSAYLVPYNDSKTKTTQARLQIGYRGLIDLARRGGEVASIEAFNVYKGDEFSVRLGTERKIVHVPKANGTEEPGDIVAVYAVAVLRDGTMQFDVMWRASIDRIYRSSKSDGGPWITHFGEMSKKTMVRRLAKYLPMTTELRRALETEALGPAGGEDEFGLEEMGMQVETPATASEKFLQTVEG